MAGKKTETSRYIIERYEDVPAGFLWLGKEQVTYITDKETGETVRSAADTTEEADRNGLKDIAEANKHR